MVVSLVFDCMMMPVVLFPFDVVDDDDVVVHSIMDWCWWWRCTWYYSYLILQHMVHMMHILSILSSVGLCRCHMFMYVKYQHCVRMSTESRPTWIMTLHVLWRSLRVVASASIKTTCQYTLNHSLRQHGRSVNTAWAEMPSTQTTVLNYYIRLDATPPLIPTVNP